MGVLHAYMSVHHVYAVHQEGRRGSYLDFLRLKLQTVVSCYVGAGFWIWVLWESSQCS